MLNGDVERYIAMRRAAGFGLKCTAHVLRDFAQFASARGDRYVRGATVVDWARRGRSPARREHLLRVVIGFARHASAENARHEVLPTGLFGSPYRRPVPFIFAPEQIRRIIEEAYCLEPAGSLRPHMYAALLSLLAATGLRVSEALSLKYDDITPDGLVIRMTKFRKSRLVPLHVTAEAGLQQYLVRRRRLGGAHVFVGTTGRQPHYATVRWTFRRLVRAAGLDPKPGQPKPQIHSLRHTFAVRALETCPGEPKRIARHQVALSTYLGHAHVESTYWYLSATPELLSAIAVECEAYVTRGGP
jgi:integrase/recombinase XerD